MTSVPDDVTSNVNPPHLTMKVLLATSALSVAQRTSLVEIINASYRIGEAGIIEDLPERPFCRTSLDELNEWIDRGDIIVACEEEANDSNESSLIGCIKVSKSPEYCELGCLAVSTEYQGKGIGNLLFQAAEDQAKSLGKSHCRLDLLSPRDWKQKHKERLRAWYERQGYSPMGEPQQLLKSDASLGAEIRLATDALLESFEKQLL